MNTSENKFYAIIRDKDAPFHCRKLPQDYRPKKNKKTFVVYPGLGCRNEEQANGMLKIIEKELGSLADSCDLICLYYPDLPKDMPYAEKRQSAKETGDIALKRFILPLISKTNEDGEPERLSANVAAAAAANLNFYPHCYGSYIVESHEEALKKLMPELKYLPAETDYILKQIVCFHHNNISDKMGEYEAQMSHIERLTKSDKKRQERHYNSGSFQAFIQNEQLSDDEVLCVALTQNEYALLLNQITKEGGDEHNGGQWEDLKTPAGQKEENIVRAAMRERATSNRPIKDVPDLLYQAHRDGFMDIKYDTLNEVIGYGEEMSEDYHEYRRKNKTENMIAIKKITTRYCL